MSGSKSIELLVAGVFIMCVAVRFIWLMWRDPLRERSPFQQRILGASVLGVARPKVVHTRLRTGPAMGITLFFLGLAGFLTGLGADGHAATYAYVATGLAVVLWMLVALFNRPHWAVPPAVRAEPGMIAYERRQPDPPFRDPRLPPPHA